MLAVAGAVLGSCEGGSGLWACNPVERTSRHEATSAVQRRFRAVQISGMVDSVGLILLDKLVSRPVMSKTGWGSRASAAPTALPRLAPRHAGAGRIILHRYPSPSGLGSHGGPGRF